MADQRSSHPPPWTVERGEVLRYFPVTGLDDYIRVRAMGEPYQVGDAWLVKCRGIVTSEIYYASIDNLKRPT